MAHLRVAVYTLIGGTLEEAAELARTGMLPIFQQQPGFISYQVVDGGNSKVVSVSAWETEDEAEAATGEAADFVREHLTGRLQIQENYVGDDLLLE